jgi:hypothetical protein
MSRKVEAKWSKYFEHCDDYDDDDDNNNNNNKFSLNTQQ